MCTRIASLKSILSPTQYDVIMALAEGLANKEIAVKLNISSEQIVKNYVRAAMLRIGINDRIKLALEIQEHRHKLQMEEFAKQVAECNRCREIIRLRALDQKYGV